MRYAAHRIDPVARDAREFACAALVTAYADDSNLPVPHVREHQIWIGLGVPRAGMDKKRTDFSMVQTVIAGWMIRACASGAVWRRDPAEEKASAPRLVAVDRTASSPAHYGLAKKGANT